jgi:hypothetical protein
MVDSLATICAKKIPLWAGLADHQVVALENVKHTIKQEHIKICDQCDAMQAAYSKVYDEITSLHRSEARDKRLAEYSNMAWQSYDSAVEELNFVRNDRSADAPHYPTLSLVACRVMGCPTAGEGDMHTDENSMMFRSALSKWEQFEFPEPTDDEMVAATSIKNYFEVISKFLILYDETYGDDTQKTIELEKKMNDTKSERNKLLATKSRLRSAMSNIESAIMCRDLDLF